MRRQNGKGAKDIQADSEAPAYSRTAVKPSYGPPGKASESRLKRWEESLRKTEEKLDSRKRKLDDLENAAKDARTDLNKRQKDVAKQGRELARAQKQLEKQQLAIAEKESAVAKQEQETQDLALALSTSRAEQLIAQLEEHFFCSLCFEIIACPCTIGSSRCGHTFCALCIMKWYFSRLCPDCCTWHEDLECPLCRTPIAAPKVVPADGNTPCPFAPNRMVDGAVAELLNTIRNESTASSGSSSTSPKGKGKGKSKKTEGGVISEAIALWGEGGASRVDWQDRNRRGHAELDRLTTGWTRMGPGDYKLMKNRLAAT
ncbi:hypothetical protein WOLCODRAFT_166745 [Wolfiporia cocos MD-104 SS10]|uniref:RING-type domain-containing protein n=1 Tax=Wolfiporia cocos (strain MD-104) TaxID=742152 RepID=A0A2H3J3C8_WOLCO|nr:hypothetical protein WOLCODRAFT_166745 [Wolfiporia cocos MD-104 SS10]